MIALEETPIAGEAEAKPDIAIAIAIATVETGEIIIIENNIEIIINIKIGCVFVILLINSSRPNVAYFV